MSVRRATFGFVGATWPSPPILPPLDEFLEADVDLSSLPQVSRELTSAADAVYADELRSVKSSKSMPRLSRTNTPGINEELRSVRSMGSGSHGSLPSLTLSKEKRERRVQLMERKKQLQELEQATEEALSSSQLGSKSRSSRASRASRSSAVSSSSLARSLASSRLAALEHEPSPLTLSHRFPEGDYIADSPPRPWRQNKFRNLTMSLESEFEAALAPRNEPRQWALPLDLHRPFVNPNPSPEPTYRYMM